jgi:hypothetical protein
MLEKPTTAKGYTQAHTLRVRATCLYLATKLGALVDELVIVGGLVPGLLIDQANLPRGAELHVGTVDLDIVLSVMLLVQERYKEVGVQLRRAGFEPDLNNKGNPSRQRWGIGEGATRVTVDFLIPPTLDGDQGGRIRDLEEDFAAFIMPGTHLAFADREQIVLEGKTLFGEQAKRSIYVCGPGAYVVLKARALRMRGENKDAYDLYYLLRNYRPGVEAIARRLAPLMNDESARQAIEYLLEDYAILDSIGPSRAAEFLDSGLDDNIQVEAVGFVAELLSRLSGFTEQAK